MTKKVNRKNRHYDFLTEQQVKFCRAYVSHGDHNKAVVEAGYAKKSAKEMARKLMNNDKVLARIDTLRDRADIASIATHEECCTVLTDIIRCRVGDFIDDDGRVSTNKMQELKASHAISELDVQEGKDDRLSPRIKIRMCSKISAIDKLSELRGYKEEKKPDKGKGTQNLQINIVSNSDGNNNGNAVNVTAEEKGAQNGIKRDTDTSEDDSGRELGDGGS